MNGKSKISRVRLGRSGLKISRLILGCMSYGSPEWQDWVLSEDEGIKHIKAAYDAGINTFDTANVYSNGLSEVVLGKAIKQHNLPREEIVVMTKLLDGSGYANQYGLSRKHIFDSVKQSLERLQLDCIDLLQCHRFDTETPIEETMHALHDIVKAGYVRYIGMSSCWAYQYYAIQNNLTHFISMQNHYSLVYREEEREMFPTLKYFGVGSIPWSPLARGLLSRPLDHQTKRGHVEEIAKKKNAKMAQIAIAWVMARDGVTAPIIGTTSLDNLDELLAAVDIKLSEDDMKYLEELYEPRSIIGHS
ncbi:NADP-dependent oxidoreductase domain-containing protein [Lentinula boryana]|uniref:NADP-dependent oxidoreductase domain-containing protein n=1 Tax=Lentinula boryana TaxID=40481 RepID=A0ABQ8Q307_9AGAR|nr:NADP-dependent oxidoreductase domain-containing protein [Lentinula boryana]